MRAGVAHPAHAAASASSATAIIAAMPTPGEAVEARPDDRFPWKTSRRSGPGEQPALADLRIARGLRIAPDRRPAPGQGRFRTAPTRSSMSLRGFETVRSELPVRRCLQSPSPAPARRGAGWRPRRSAPPGPRSRAPSPSSGAAPETRGGMTLAGSARAGSATRATRRADGRGARCAWSRAPPPARGDRRRRPVRRSPRG